MKNRTTTYTHQFILNNDVSKHQFEVLRLVTKCGEPDSRRPYRFSIASSSSFWSNLYPCTVLLGLRWDIPNHLRWEAESICEFFSDVLVDYSLVLILNDSTWIVESINYEYACDNQTTMDCELYFRSGISWFIMSRKKAANCGWCFNYLDGCGFWPSLDEDEILEAEDIVQSQQLPHKFVARYHRDIIFEHEPRSWIPVDYYWLRNDFPDGCHTVSNGDDGFGPLEILSLHFVTSDDY